MTVYVDDDIWKWRGKLWAHMTADTAEELHRFAKSIGLKRAWFQDKDHHQHYDVTSSKRLEALAAGAVYVPMREYSVLYRTLPIAAAWNHLLTEYEADQALGYEGEELVQRAHDRFWAYKADKALELPEKRRRSPRK